MVKAGYHRDHADDARANQVHKAGGHRAVLDQTPALEHQRREEGGVGADEAIVTPEQFGSTLRSRAVSANSTPSTSEPLMLMTKCREGNAPLSRSVTHPSTR